MTPKNFTVTLRESFPQNYHSHEHTRVHLYDPKNVIQLSKKVFLKSITRTNIHAVHLHDSRDLTITLKKDSSQNQHPCKHTRVQVYDRKGCHSSLKIITRTNEHASIYMIPGNVAVAFKERFLKIIT